MGLLVSKLRNLRGLPAMDSKRVILELNFPRGICEKLTRHVQKYLILSKKWTEFGKIRDHIRITSTYSELTELRVILGS